MNIGQSMDVDSFDQTIPSTLNSIGRASRHHSDVYDVEQGMSKNSLWMGLWETWHPRIVSSALHYAIVSADDTSGDSRPLDANADQPKLAAGIFWACESVLYPCSSGLLLRYLSEKHEFGCVRRLLTLLDWRKSVDGGRWTSVDEEDDLSVLIPPWLRSWGRLLRGNNLVSWTAVAALQECWQWLGSEGAQEVGGGITLLKRGSETFETQLLSAAPDVSASNHWDFSTHSLGTCDATIGTEDTHAVGEAIAIWLTISLLKCDGCRQQVEDDVLSVGEALWQLSSMPSFDLLLRSFGRIDNEALEHSQWCYDVVSSVLLECPAFLLSLLRLRHLKYSIELFDRSLKVISSSNSLLKAANDALDSAVQSISVLKDLSAVATTAETNKDLIYVELLVEVQGCLSCLFSVALHQRLYDDALQAVRKLAGLAFIAPVASSNIGLLRLRQKLSVNLWKELLRALVNRACDTLVDPDMSSVSGQSNGLAWLCSLEFPLYALNAFENVGIPIPSNFTYLDLTETIISELEALAMLTDLPAAKMRAMKGSSVNGGVAQEASVDLNQSLNTSLFTTTNTLYGTRNFENYSAGLQKSRDGDGWNTSLSAEYHLKTGSMATSIKTPTHTASANTDSVNYYDCLASFLLCPPRNDPRSAAQVMHMLAQRLDAVCGSELKKSNQQHIKTKLK